MFDTSGLCPWIISGDFNVCLNLDESTSFTGLTTGMNDFRDAVAALNVFDLNFSGSFHTWWDGNHANPVQKKLDRSLVNVDWLSVFPLSRAQFLPRGLSDHNLVLIFLGIDAEKIRKPFQVFQFIIEHPKFTEKVAEAWNISIHGDPWYILSMKLKMVKLALKQLNRSTGNLHEAVINAKHDLLQFQSNLPIHPTVDMFSQEAELSFKLQQALSKEESLQGI